MNSSFKLLRVLLVAGMVLQPCAAPAGKSPGKAAPAGREFFRAVQKGDIELIRSLIAEGADVNVSAGGLTPLMVAGDPETVRLLARAGADVNARSEVLKQTALVLAVTGGKLDIVRTLVEVGADVNAKDGASGVTALSQAIMNKRAKIEMIEVLLEAGADPNDGLVLDMPMLSLAALGGRIDVVKALIAGGADIHARDRSGATVLMTAVTARKADVAKVLMEAGADADGGTDSPEGRKAGGNGATPMDTAKAVGDDELVGVLAAAGAKESVRLPGPDLGGLNPPGLYGLDCRIAGSPPPPGREFSCSAVGQAVASGTETAIFSKAFFEGVHAVPTKDGCVADLGSPGSYTIRTWETATPWKLVCRYRLGTTSGGANWIAYLEKEKARIKKTEKKITVAAPGKKVPAERKEPVTIVIVKPKNGEQFAFDDDEPDTLKIEAEAKVTGDCDDAPTWEVEEVGESEKRLDPEGASHEVTIRFKGLPAENSHFGKKRITARACGKSAAVTVETFFSPEEKNHPGKGGGETPNWFYYWGKTRAGGGAANDLKYTKNIPASNRAGDLVIGRFDPSDQRILLSDQVFTLASCTDRVLWGTGDPGGAARRGVDVRPATGIDCFAEVIMHEWQHRVEYYNWRGEDLDEDGVPHDVEAVTRGCVDDDLNIVDLMGKTADWERSWYSCARRPFNDVTDREIDAYYAGWKWPIDKAKHEDWSWCGKQWKDASLCPDGKLR